MSFDSAVLENIFHIWTSKQMRRQATAKTFILVAKGFKEKSEGKICLNRMYMYV